MRYLIMLIALLFVGCTNVPQGSVGIKVRTTGSERGIDSNVYPAGWSAISPTEKMYTYPVYTTNYSFTKDVTEGSPTNEEFMVQSSDGLMCGLDIGLEMHFEQSKVVDMFKKYRKDVEGIRNIVVRNSIRDALNTYGSKLTAEEIFATKKMDLIDSVRVKVTRDLLPTGIFIEKLTVLNGVRPPESIQKAINAKVAATQMAIQRENELRTAEAEAKKLIAEAEGVAQSNRLKTVTASPEVIRMMELDVQREWVAKWDGKMPANMVPAGAQVMMGLK